MSPKPLRHLGDYDVAVIGGGIVGSMIARELSKLEGRFALLEKEAFPGFGVSKASLSQVHLPDFCPPGSLKGRLCREAPARFKRLAAELDVDYRETDELFLALEPSHMNNLEEARKRGEANGATGYEIIGPKKIRELEPHVTKKAVAGLYARGLGVIYPPEWTFALTENAAQNGVHIHLETTVTAIERKSDASLLVSTTKGTLSTRYVINAAGLYADEIAWMVGDRQVRLALRKGTMVIFDKSISHLVRHMIFGTFAPTHSQNIAPTAHGNLILGIRYVETDQKWDTNVSREGILETMKLGKQLVPAISEKDIITSFSGILSTNNMARNGDFHIAPSEHVPNVIHVLVGAPGLTAAPGIAELVVRLLLEAGMETDEKRGFQKRRGWPRFESASFSEKLGVIASNPKYGHVLCRCEQVTEAEILEAMERGALTLDSIKHLTRAGMGRCQGGFCGITMLKLLAQHLGVPLTEVTKNGKGSHQLTGQTKAVDQFTGNGI